MPTAPHSPAPWTARGTRVFAADTSEVCDVCPPGPNNVDTFDANRDLICAAPSMLEALKEAEFLLDQVLKHPGVTLNIIRAVIGKAEGR